MKKCRPENLAKLMADQLDIDGKLEALEHLDECEKCREAFFQLSRARDAAFFIHRPYDIEKAAAPGRR